MERNKDQYGRLLPDLKEIALDKIPGPGLAVAAINVVARGVAPAFPPVQYFVRPKRSQENLDLGLNPAALYLVVGGMSAQGIGIIKDCKMMRVHSSRFESAYIYGSLPPLRDVFIGRSAVTEPEQKEPQQQINSLSEPGVHQVIFAEPAPRPKVGDWVEVDYYNEHKIARIKHIELSNITYKLLGAHEWKTNKNVILRILPKSEEIDPQTEPASPLKVGDWVEYNHAGKKRIGKVRRVSTDMVDLYMFDQSKVPFWCYMGECKKFSSPSEVKVTITLEGTVEPAGKSGFFIGTNYVLYDNCSPADAEMVRELVED